MPYIKQDRRIPLTMACPLTPSELNYAFTRMALGYIERHGKDYQHISEVIGAFECAKLEFYRREFYRRDVVPYEDQKIAENGDVYP